MQCNGNMEDDFEWFLREVGQSGSQVSSVTAWLGPVFLGEFSATNSLCWKFSTSGFFLFYVFYNLHVLMLEFINSVGMELPFCPSEI